MDVLRTTSADEFQTKALEKILNVIRANPKAVIGLSGGSTPKPLYQALAKENLDGTTFFLIDERYVPSDDKDSNTKMIREAMPTVTLIAPNTSLSLDECIADYNQKISALETIDLVILGMGEDAHTASLFPPLEYMAYGPSAVIHTTTDTFAVRDRITVTLPILTKAKERLFLITGEKKVKLLQKMQGMNLDPSEYPPQALFDEKTTWIVGA